MRLTRPVLLLAATLLLAACTSPPNGGSGEAADAAPDVAAYTAVCGSAATLANPHVTGQQRHVAAAELATYAPLAGYDDVSAATAEIADTVLAVTAGLDEIAPPDDSGEAADWDRFDAEVIAIETQVDAAVEAAGLLDALTEFAAAGAAAGVDVCAALLDAGQPDPAGDDPDIGAEQGPGDGPRAPGELPADVPAVEVAGFLGDDITARAADEGVSPRNETLVLSAASYYTTIVEVDTSRLADEGLLSFSVEGDTEACLTLPAGGIDATVAEGAC